MKEFLIVFCAVLFAIGLTKIVLFFVLKKMK